VTHEALTAPEGGISAPGLDDQGLPLVVDQVALARLYGEPLFAMPTDLYIPPDALEVFLETVGLPLDLLLYPKESFSKDQQHRITEQHPHFQRLRQTWSQGLVSLFDTLPPLELS